MAGQVRAGGHVLVKPATMVDPAAPLDVLEPERYVSRGGYKLEAALREFAIELDGRRCLDVGASTGGFTDCMLQHGAASVLAVDVGRAQLHQRLREDPRVTLWGHTNARDMPALTPLDFFAIDLSFISVRKVLPALHAGLREPCEGIVLLKPQFELAPANIPAGGVIRDAELRMSVAESFRSWLTGEHWRLHHLIDCPVSGGDGNVEFLAHVETPREQAAC